mmetsp:Transcript_11400/g.31134  ORF Transcript_11400/g.31134 Transcript_11400/m.31134 type:complete len:218 (+) Transcript_11400:137-790(+)
MCHLLGRHHFQRRCVGVPGVLQQAPRHGGVRPRVAAPPPDLPHMPGRGLGPTGGGAAGAGPAQAVALPTVPAGGEASASSLAFRRRLCRAACVSWGDAHVKVRRAIGAVVARPAASDSRCGLEHAGSKGSARCRAGCRFRCAFASAASPGTTWRPAATPAHRRCGHAHRRPARTHIRGPACCCRCRLGTGAGTSTNGPFTGDSGGLPLLLCASEAAT